MKRFLSLLGAPLRAEIRIIENLHGVAYVQREVSWFSVIWKIAPFELAGQG